MAESRNEVIVTVKGLTDEDIENFDIRIVSEDRAVLEPKSSSYKIVGEFFSAGFTFAGTYAAIASDFSAQFLPDSVAHFHSAPAFLLGHVFNRVMNRATSSFSTGVERLGWCFGFTLRGVTAAVSTGLAIGGDALLEHYNCYSENPKARDLEKAAVGFAANTLGRLLEAGIAKCAQSSDDREIRVSVTDSHSTMYGRGRARLLDHDHSPDIEMGRVKKGRN